MTAIIDYPQSYANQMIVCIVIDLLYELLPAMLCGGVQGYCEKPKITSDVNVF